MFEKKVLPCSKTKYTQFLGLCCTLRGGIKTWNILSLVATMFSVILFFLVRTFYTIPILKFVSSILALCGVSNKGLKGAKLLRVHILMYLLDIIVRIITTTVVVTLYFVNVPNANESKMKTYLTWLTWLQFAALFFEMILMHVYFSSVESLAAVKIANALEAAQAAHHIEKGPVNFQADPSDSPKIIVVQHVMIYFHI